MTGRAGGAGAAALLLLAAGCGGEPPVPGIGPSVRIEAPAGEVDFGKGFPLSVVRTWDAGSTPGEWDEGVLRPLRVGAGEVRTREAGGRIEETRTFRAHAFALDEVRVAPIRFEARPGPGGAAAVAESRPLVLRVRPSLDPSAPGPPEFPGDPAPPPRSPWVAVVAAAAALLGAALLLRARRPPGPGTPAPAGPPPERPADRARARLAALRPLAAGGAAEAELLHEEAAAVLREFVAEETGFPALERTTGEVAADPAVAASLGEGRREGLRSVLARCDLVKFAGARPGAAEGARLLDDAERIAGGGA